MGSAGLVKRGNGNWLEQVSLHILGINLGTSIDPESGAAASLSARHHPVLNYIIITETKPLLLILSYRTAGSVSIFELLHIPSCLLLRTYYILKLVGFFHVLFDPM